MNAPETVSAPTAPHHALRAVAPAWHTIIVLIVLFGLSAAGAATHGLPRTGRAQGRAIGYVIVMIYEWATVAFIWWGVRRCGVRVRDLVGGDWARPVNFFRDLGIAIGFLVTAQIVLGILNRLLKAAANQAIRNLFPHGATEVVLFLLLALTAGFCEELIFRGYLQRQFAALTHAVAGGIVVQGILFGAAHGYQGWKLMLVIAVFGTMFGLLANWRRSLRPGMLAHFIQDGVGGLVGSRVMR
jgi:membrane protease YdiL (CAAX protease family)